MFSDRVNFLLQSSVNRRAGGRGQMTTEQQSRRMRFVDLPLTVKILSAVVLTLVVAVGVGLLGLVKLSGTADQVQAMYVEQVKPLGVLANARSMALQGRIDNL